MRGEGDRGVQGGEGGSGFLLIEIRPDTNFLTTAGSENSFVLFESRKTCVLKVSMQRFSRFLRILIFIVMIFQSLYLVLGLVKVKVYHGGMSAVLVCCRGHNPTGPHHGEGGHLCHPSCGGGGHRRCSCGGGCSRSGGHGGCFWWLVL